MPPPDYTVAQRGGEFWQAAKNEQTHMNEMLVKLSYVQHSSSSWHEQNPQQTIGTTHKVEHRRSYAHFVEHNSSLSQRTKLLILPVAHMGLNNLQTPTDHTTTQQRQRETQLLLPRVCLELAPLPSTGEDSRGWCRLEVLFSFLEFEWEWVSIIVRVLKPLFYQLCVPAASALKLFFTHIPGEPPYQRGHP